MRLTVKVPVLVIAALLLVPAVAAAQPPVVKSVSQSGRRLTVKFSAPNAAPTVGGVTIYVARSPAQGPDGAFPAPNVADEGVLTPQQIASGSWTEQNPLLPGRYWVMVAANPNLNTCTLQNGTVNSSCASGDSKVESVSVVASTQYRASVASKHGGSLSLRLVATPLGTTETLKLCYAVTVRKRSSRHCLKRRLTGIDWNEPADDLVKLSTRGMSARETFTWSLSGKTVTQLTVKLR